MTSLHSSEEPIAEPCNTDLALIALSELFLFWSALGLFRSSVSISAVVEGKITIDVNHVTEEVAPASDRG